MITPELVEYIRSALARGVTREAITATLLPQGWTPGDVNMAFEKIAAPAAMPSTATVPREVKEVNPPVDAPFVAPANTMPVMPTSPASSPSSGSDSISVSEIQTAQPVYSKSSSVAYNTTRDGHPGHRILVGVVIVLLLACVGVAGTYAYFTFLQPTISPEEILQKSFDVTRDGTIRSFSYTASTTGQISAPNEFTTLSSANYAVSAKGVMDYRDLKNSKGTIDLDVAMNTNDATTSASLNVALKTIVLNSLSDNKVYFNFTNFKVDFMSSDPKQAQTQMIVAMANGFMAGLTNKWIYATSSAANTSAIKGNALTQADQDAINAYLAEKTYINSIETVGIESVGGTDMYHLKIDLRDEGKLVDLIRSIVARHKEVTASDKASIEKGITLIGTIAKKGIVLDVWVDKETFKLRKVLTSSIAINDAETKVKSSARYEIDLGDFNKEFDVSAPASSTSIEEIMKNMFGGLMGADTAKPATKAKTTTKSVKK